MFKYALIAALIPSMVLGSYLFTECKNKAPTPFEVRVKDCEETPCSIPNGEVVDMDMDFEILNATKTLTAHLEIYWGNFKVPYELPEDQQDACKELIGASCPLKGGEKLSYTLKTEAEAPFVGILVDLVFSFIDDQGRRALCFKTACKIVDPKQN